MSEFSAEDIERAADELRRGGFGDFMFRDPGHQYGTTSSQVTTRRNTSRRLTSSSSRTTSHTNPVSQTKRYNCHTEWRNTPHGNTQMKASWEDGNMWELWIKQRK